MDNRWLRPRLIVGLFVVGAGIVFALDELGMADAADFLQWWPLVLVAIGLMKWFDGQRHRLLAFSLTFAGLWFLAINLGYLAADYMDLWPLLLITVGGALVYSAFRHADLSRVGSDDGNAIHEVVVLAGKKVVNSSPRFRGGNLTAALGGIEVDLRQAQIEGEEAVLDCVAFWGGGEISVPRQWRVVNQVLPILGGVEDATEPPAEEEAPRLRITGLAVMGGLVINNGEDKKPVSAGSQ